MLFGSSGLGAIHAVLGWVTLGPACMDELTGLSDFLLLYVVFDDCYLAVVI
jgi:hypothetical protein